MAITHLELFDDKLSVNGIDTDNNDCSEYVTGLKMNTDENYHFCLQLIDIDTMLDNEIKEKEEQNGQDQN